MLDNINLDPDAPVLVIGAASIDIVGKLQGELQHGTSNPAHIRTSFGGTARNVAENLARLGLEVHLLTAIGKGTIGNQLLKHSANAGVNTDHIIRTTQRPTGSYLAMVDQQGELQFALDDMRAITALTPEYLQQNQNLFEESGVLFLDANLPADTLETALELASKADLLVCADPTSAPLASRLRPYLPNLFLLTPNSAEAAVLTDHPVANSEEEQGLQAAKRLVAQGVDFAIVTLAEFGVCYATSEVSGHIPAIRTKIIDPTGGGDALSAAVIFALLNNIPADEAVRLGVSAASLTLQHSGAVLPDLSLEALYDHLSV